MYYLELSGNRNYIFYQRLIKTITKLIYNFDLMLVHSIFIVQIYL